jgi:hypothetical protein
MQRDAPTGIIPAFASRAKDVKRTSATGSHDMKAVYILAGAVAVAAAYGAGTRQAPTAPEPPPVAPVTKAPAPPLANTDQPLPLNHPPIPNQPVSAPEVPIAAQELAGEVKETIDVSGYTYLRIQTASAEVWAAVPTAKIKVGEKAKVVGGMEMKSFTSSTLKRTFESIYFGNLEQAPAGAASPHAK